MIHTANLLYKISFAGQNYQQRQTEQLTSEQTEQAIEEKLEQLTRSRIIAWSKSSVHFFEEQNKSRKRTIEDEQNKNSFLKNRPIEGRFSHCISPWTKSNLSFGHSKCFQHDSWFWRRKQWCAPQPQRCWSGWYSICHQCHPPCPWNDVGTSFDLAIYGHKSTSPCPFWWKAPLVPVFKQIRRQSWVQASHSHVVFFIQISWWISSDRAWSLIWTWQNSEVDQSAQRFGSMLAFGFWLEVCTLTLSFLQECQHHHYIGLSGNASTQSSNLLH